MIKLLSSSVSRQIHPTHLAFPLRPAPGSRSPLIQALSHITGLTQMASRGCQRAFFCSGDGSGDEVAAGDESKSWFDRMYDGLSVLVLPVSHKPMFPGYYMPTHVEDPKLLAALHENHQSRDYAGAFLLKDEPGTDSSMVTGSESEKSIHELKGKELFDRLHKVGTLVKIEYIRGECLYLNGLRRMQITEMVNEDLLTVKVDQLKDLPYNEDDDEIKATSNELISTSRDIMKTSFLWRDRVDTYIQNMGVFRFHKLADFGAVISEANKLQLQAVLEERDVSSPRPNY